MIEWIKGLLAVPFVLHSQPTVIYQEDSENLVAVAADTHQRYVEIFRDVESLIRDHSMSFLDVVLAQKKNDTKTDMCVRPVDHESKGHPGKSKLKLLVPTVGSFFTPLHIEDAFKYQDRMRSISRRRFVAPSFNDIRLILNSAQLLGLVRTSHVDLVTFDGDVTLYDDGASLTADNPSIPRLLRLLRQDRKVGIVTAAGYTEAEKYYGRLKGLLDAVHEASDLSAAQRAGLVVMGGESNFLFRYDAASPYRLSYVHRNQWLLPEMTKWQEADITALLDLAESSLRACVKNLGMPVTVLRKDRAVGVSPVNGTRVNREQLEETVLVVQNTIERSAVGGRLPFCAFNGEPFPCILLSLVSFPSADNKSPIQEATTSSSTSATNHGECAPASSISAASNEPARCMSAISSCLRARMISRYILHSLHLSICAGRQALTNLIDVGPSSIHYSLDRRSI